MSNELYKTKINKIDLISNFGIFFFLSLAFLFRNNKDGLDGIYISGGLITLLLIWTLWKFKVFVLNKNELIIKRIFFFQSFNKIHNLKQIDHVLFMFEKGRSGGNKMIVYSIFVDDFYRYSINLNKNQLKDFIEILQKNNITVINKIE